MKNRILHITFLLISLLTTQSVSADFVSKKVNTYSEENYLFKSDRLTVSHLYPNPAFDYVDVDVQLNGTFSEVKIVIFNILGQEVKVHSLDNSLRTHRIDLRDLNPGMYPYQLVVDGKSLVTKKLIVR